jgi:tRNA-specific 2-thiouridylase
MNARAPYSGRTIAVGLSGGVDSAVAASLLIEGGAEVIGLTMRVYDGELDVKEGAKHACYGPGEDEDIAECERLCASLGIPYKVVDLRAEYRDAVLGYFREEYLRGRTPNPCVRCNHELKFGFLLSRARAEGVRFDAFATGHYARIDRSGAFPRLMTAAYEAKDQTYFLHRLPRATLERVEFPLGDMTKDRVRDKARAMGFEMADKPESQDFVAGGDYSTVFSGDGNEPGDFVDESGRVLGRHKGIVHYTIGQRRGIGLSAPARSGEDPAPLYVAAIDAARNRIVVAPDSGLFADGLVALDARCNLELCDGESGLPKETLRFRAKARVRQNHRPAPCEVTLHPDASLELRFDAPVRAIAPGQSVALYGDSGYVLGGAIIERGMRE